MKENSDTFLFASREYLDRNCEETLKIYDNVFKKDWNLIKNCLLERSTFMLKNDPTIKGRLIDDERLIEEYIEILIRVYKLNISETNSIFSKINDAKKSIESKSEIDNYELTFYEENIKKLRVYKLGEHIHWFQKYSNWELKSIIEKDPLLILKFIRDLDHFSIENMYFILCKHNLVLDLKNSKLHGLYVEALEINLIKQLVIKKWYVREDPTEERYNYTDSDTLRDAFDGDEGAMWERFYQ